MLRGPWLGNLGGLAAETVRVVRTVRRKLVERLDPRNVQGRLARRVLPFHGNVLLPRDLMRAMDHPLVTARAGNRARAVKRPAPTHKSPVEKRFAMVSEKAD